MEFGVLGTFQIIDGGQVRQLSAGGELAVLALLVLNAGRVVTTDALIDASWGERPPANPANALQVRVSKLRRALQSAGAPETLLVTRRPGYLLDIDPQHVDAHRFVRLVDDARRAAELDPEEATRRYQQALGLWRGPALPEFAGQQWAVPTSPAPTSPAPTSPAPRCTKFWPTWSTGPWSSRTMAKARAFTCWRRCASTRANASPSPARRRRSKPRTPNTSPPRRSAPNHSCAAATRAGCWTGYASNATRRAWQTASGTPTAAGPAAAALEGLACVAAAHGDAHQAASLLGAAHRWRQAGRSPATPTEQHDIDRAADHARKALASTTTRRRTKRYPCHQRHCSPT